MKKTLNICLLLALVCLCVSSVAADTTVRRGIATLSTKYSNSTLSITKRGGGDNGSGRGTWYSGGDLNDAACYDRKGLDSFSATIHDLIGAMAMDDFEECYKCMQITNNKNKKLSVVIKVVDKCAGCEVGKAIDLTPAAFQKVAPGGDLDLGVLDISWKPVKCPKSKLFPAKPIVKL
ncbi:hypothetical protein BCR43DRAFT_476486 [Syncephalastrum racemosum]|uniref:Barwin domain-containing protein n=1 Tax=Syncephalastrum racemosum TaxID=13706 RepID=A0A1X2H7V8_SYNRA|nr:hypothetical protein BCR43DRAFT_476486 [Syncephalastrum racemosum]